MGIAVVSIAPESLIDVLAMMQAHGVDVLGSRESERRDVRLVIEGISVPDATLVTGKVTTVRNDGYSSITLTFEEVQA